MPIKDGRVRLNFNTTTTTTQSLIRAKHTEGEQRRKKRAGVMKVDKGRGKKKGKSNKKYERINFRGQILQVVWR